MIREVLAPVASVWRAYLVGAAHALAVVLACLAFWAWLYGWVL